jgi:hypothetical protein
MKEEGTLFTAIRTYRIAPDQLEASMHKLDVEFADELAQLEGFVAYEVIRTGDNMIATITTCREAETVERTNHMAADWVMSALSGVDIERLGMFSGEVLVSRAVAEMLVPAHY